MTTGKGRDIMKKVSLLLVLLLLLNVLGLGAVSPVTANPSNPPAAPSNLTAVAGLDDKGEPLIRLSWKDNSTDETGFIIERSESEIEGFSLISAVGPDREEFTDTGLKRDTTYWYRVSAYNGAGDPLYSNVAGATTFPFPPSDRPTDLEATAVTDTQINLSWTYNAVNEKGFKIERRTSAGDFQQIGQVGAGIITYADTGLVPGVTYTYRVRAYNDGGNSEYSKETSATTGGVPSAPKDLKAIAVSGSQINLTWADTSNNEAGFKIERKSGSGGFSQITTLDPNSTAFSDTKLSAGIYYTYRIRAYNDAGDSAYSAEAGAETGVIPIAPSGLSAKVVSDSRIDLSWKDNSNNENGFKIERKASGGSFKEIASVGKNATSYSDTSGLSAGITYTYRVKAYNNIGDSDYSAAASAVTGVIPATPSDLEATTVSKSKIKLTWTDRSNNETGFKIERRVGGGSYSQIATVAANITTYSDTGLSAGKTYYYRVRAYNSTGNSAYSNQVSTTTSTPDAPSDLSAETLSYTQIELSWEDNSNNETGFKIERKKEGGSFSQIGTVGADVTTYKDYDLTANTTYFYRVRAYNSIGNSAYCAEVNAVTSFLGAPSKLAAKTISGSQINLSWKDNAGNETGFKIERRTSKGSYKQIATVGKNKTSYSDKGLADNTTYYYRVRAYNSSTNSAYSNESSTTTGSIPTAPSNLTAAPVSSSRISLTWKDSSNNETGFKIERKKSGGSYKQITTLSANTTSYTDTGLSSDATYYYRVRAYNSIGNSTYSNEATVAMGAPAAPTKLTAAAVSSSRISLTWKDSSNNETGFKIERKKSGGSYKQITTLSANTTSYTDTGLSSGVTYYYRVRAYNSIGNSTYSNEADATTTAEAEKIIVLHIGKRSYYVNNRRLEMDAAPIISENRTLLPIRYVAEAIGAVLKWDSSQRKTTIIFKGKVMELWIGSNTARVDGEPKLIDPDNRNVKPIILPPGRTMLPLRFVSENLGCQVDWNRNSQEIKITYPAP
jgi:transcriptional regulator CtsR